MTNNTRFCHQCQQEKTVDQFYKCKQGSRQPYSSYCKICMKERWRQYCLKNRGTAKPQIEQKICTKCNQSLPIVNFNSNPSNKDGFSTRCKNCIKLYHQEYHKNIKAIPKEIIEGKVCAVCKIYKLYEDFSIDRQRKDGLNYACRECSKSISKKNNIKNRAQKMRRKKERLRTDPTFKLVEGIRHRILMAIKNQSKFAKSLELLGCTGAECMDYLERLFWPGMTRENYGVNGWVIDHIIPIDAFDKTDPNWQFKAFHYTNLQPLWKYDNDKKSSRFDWSPTESKYELPERLKAQSTSEPIQPLPHLDNHKEQSKP